jgi:hypothetical protein
MPNSLHPQSTQKKQYLITHTESKDSKKKEPSAEKKIQTISKQMRQA